MRELIPVRHGVEPTAPRRFPIYRPHWHERPEELLARDISCETELDWIRIAKDEGEVIAAYEIEQNDPWNFSVLSLTVSQPYQNQGLGRWMLLHAVGLIESKGGRVVHARCRNQTDFVTRIGFTKVSNEHFVMQLQPE